MLAVPSTWSVLSDIQRSFTPVFRNTGSLCQTNADSDKELCQTNPSWPIYNDLLRASFPEAPRARSLDVLSTSVPKLQTTYLLPRTQLEDIIRRPSSDTLRPKVGTLPPMAVLENDLSSGRFWDRRTLFSCLGEIFATELDFLKSAYATSYPSNGTTASPTPSQIIFDSPIRCPEVDRTVTGIMALYWIYWDDYEGFTKHQNPAMKLSRASFNQLRGFFERNLDGFRDPNTLRTLIVMQMTNDLGKSQMLKEQFRDIKRADAITPNENHDVFMSEVLRYTPSLVPSINALPRRDRKIVKRLTGLSSKFSPPQLIQGECSPRTLEALTIRSYSQRDLNLKFMELFLDISGAAGHVNHEGAVSMTEPVFQGLFKALEISREIASGSVLPEDGYLALMQFRFDYIDGLPVSEEDEILDDHMQWGSYDVAMARILSMGRVADAQAAYVYQQAFESLPSEIRDGLIYGLGGYELIEVIGCADYGDLYGVQATYFPSLLALAKDKNEHLWQDRVAALLEFLAYIVRVEAADNERLSMNWDIELSSIAILERDVREWDEVVKSETFRFEPSVELLLNHREDGKLPAIHIARR